MKLSFWYEFTETEEQAREMCEQYRKKYPRRKKHTATYTPWSNSRSANDPMHFIVWTWR